MDMETVLLANGPIGALALGLLWTVRVLWAENRRLHEKIDALQQKRVEEAHATVRDLAEATATIKEATALVVSKGRR